MRSIEPISSREVRDFLKKFIILDFNTKNVAKID